MINKNTARAVRILKEKELIHDYEKGVMLIKDCVLIEKYTGKAYSYTLYNFNNYKKQYVGHSKKQADDKALEVLKDKIAKYEIVGATIGEGEELIKFIFNNIFEGYGYAVREDQVDLSIKMYKTLKGNEILLSDVAVGFGKTHAYLVAGIVYHLETQLLHRPIIVSTSSKELQQAIIGEYLPDISKMLLENGIIEREISAALRKGKNNYICHARLNVYLRRLRIDKKNESQYKALKALKLSREIDLDKAFGISKYDRNRICLNEAVCKTCPELTCPYQSFLKRALEDDYVFQICNHNYFTVDAKCNNQNNKKLLPEYKAVIIDEAHKLEQAAIQSYSSTVDFKIIESYIKGRTVSKSNSEHKKNVANLCSDILKTCIDINKRIFMQVTFNLDTTKYTVNITTDIRRNLISLYDNLMQADRMIIRSRNYPQKILFNIAMNIKNILEPDSITYIEKVGYDYVLIGVPKDISSLIKKDIFSRPHGTVMTSGTLAIEDDFEYIKSLLGLNNTPRRLSYMVKESPFNYMENSLIYTSQNTIYPNYENKRYIETLAQEIDRLIRASHGHSLVLFTSYEAMKAVYEILRKRRNSFPILKTAKGSGYAISEFKSLDNAVLFGCGAMWEGMNFEGDMLSHLIITKLPFLIPDPITEYRKSEMKNLEEYKQKILIPQMLLKLKQGHGRAIRTSTDTAVISILDSRVNTNYEKAVFEALPECRITSDIEDVRKFFKDKKSDGYWRKEYA